MKKTRGQISCQVIGLNWFSSFDLKFKTKLNTVLFKGDPTHFDVLAWLNDLLKMCYQIGNLNIKLLFSKSIKDFLEFIQIFNLKILMTAHYFLNIKFWSFEIQKMWVFLIQCWTSFQVEIEHGIKFFKVLIRKKS